MAYNKLREKRHARVRSRVEGTAERPRLAVYKSNYHLYAQVIDDVARKTIASIKTDDDKKAKGEKAKSMGVALAGKLKEMKIESIVFDRGGFRYHGRVAAFAEGLRSEGITF